MTAKMIYKNYSENVKRNYDQNNNITFYLTRPTVDQRVVY